MVLDDLKKLAVSVSDWGGGGFKMVKPEGFESQTFYDSDDVDARIKELEAALEKVLPSERHWMELTDELRNRIKELEDVLRDAPPPREHYSNTKPLFYDWYHIRRKQVLRGDGND